MSPHPNRSRRKRKQRARSPAIWETNVHWNLLTLPIIGLSAVLGQALVMSPLFIEIPFLNRHGWLAAPVTLAWLGAVVSLMFRPFMHLHWRVSEAIIESTQPGQGGAYNRTFSNAEFAVLEVHGPLIRVRYQSGESHLWPRWLRHAGQTYAFELHYDRLRLRSIQ